VGKPNQTKLLITNLNAPKKNGKGFQEWMSKLKEWIASEETNGQWMIYTDGTYWAKTRHGTSAAVITRGSQVVARDTDWRPATSSWDSELTALLLALEWVSQHLDIIDKDNICLLINNQGVIQSFLSMDTRSSQMMAPQINLILAIILSCNAQLRISLCSHCPSHSGICFNEEANCMVNAFVINKHAPQVTLWQHFTDRSVQLADND
jgi:ribonuclease HI